MWEKAIAFEMKIWTLINNIRTFQDVKWHKKDSYLSPLTKEKQFESPLNFINSSIWKNVLISEDDRPLVCPNFISCSSDILFYMFPAVNVKYAFAKLSGQTPKEISYPYL